MHPYRLPAFLSIFLLLASIALTHALASPRLKLERRVNPDHNSGTIPGNVAETLPEHAAGTTSGNVAGVSPEHLRGILPEHVAGTPSENVARTISYRAIEAGFFRPHTRWTPLASNPMRALWYYRALFHKRVPIFFTGHDGFSKRELEQAYADFGGFHVLGRPELGEHTLTVVKGRYNIPLVRHATRSVHQHALNAYSTRSVFGDTAASVAFGYELPPTHSMMRSSVALPSWDAVWEGVRAPENMAVREAKRQLERDHHISFQSADGNNQLGVRLLNNGKKEIQWLIDTRPVFRQIY